MIMNVTISKNFNLKEFVKSETAIKNNLVEQNRIPFFVIYNLFLLTISILQPLRNNVGRVVVTSGYRCFRLNKLIGGATNSQHLIGQAVDIITSDNVTTANYIKTLTFDQLIIYDTFIHVSYSANNNRNQIIDKQTSSV